MNNYLLEIGKSVIKITLFTINLLFEIVTEGKFRNFSTTVVNKVSFVLTIQVLLRFTLTILKSVYDTFHFNEE